LNFINLNGKVSPAGEAVIPVDNGAFRYGYGLFETMLVKDGVIRLKEYHWERLFAGMKQLYFEIPALMTAAWLEEEILRTVKKNKLEKLCRVRLQVFAGGGGLYSSESQTPMFVVECFELEPDTLTLNENGLRAGIASGVKKSADTLSNLKSCNALIYAIAARQAKEQKWNDALISNMQNNILESTIANIFWIKDHVIYTPPLSEGCVAGVMRRHIMTTVGTVAEKPLNIEALLNADEVFLTNAIKGIRWVSTIGESRYSNKMIHSVNEFCLRQNLPA
jgi:branched-chain amino acid aminotransferase